MHAFPFALLTRGAFAKEARLSLKALRLYADLGLLVPVQTDPQSGYHLYAPEQVPRARRIALLRQLGMPLERIAEVLNQADRDAALMIERYWREVEAEIAIKRQLVAYLSEALRGAPEGHYEVRLRDMSAQRTLSLKRPLYLQHLDSFIVKAQSLLVGHLRRAGARVEGGLVVTFHGEVNDDSDGPVEVSLAFAGRVPASGELILRSVPAGREAFTQVPLDQGRYPQILRAYDAVQAFTRTEGFTRVGPPREVYSQEHRRQDTFCEVAWSVA